MSGFGQVSGSDSQGSGNRGRPLSGSIGVFSTGGARQANLRRREARIQKLSRSATTLDLPSAGGGPRAVPGKVQTIGKIANRRKAPSRDPGVCKTPSYSRSTSWYVSKVKIRYCKMEATIYLHSQSKSKTVKFCSVRRFDQ